MRFIERATLHLLKLNMNRRTRLVDLQMWQIAEEMEYSLKTATRITKKLESEGYIIRHRTRGCGGAEIEVCSDNVS